jgi:16S rRNA (uracil1498-N3)-methyltransferase
MQNIPRFLIETTQVNNSRFKIEDRSQIKKIRQVLRLEVGDNILLFDGEGNEYLCTLEILANEMVTGQVNEKKQVNEELRFNITLAQAFPKAGKLDDIVKMCTEVGVMRFAFFESDHSIPKLRDFKESKLERFSKIIEEAARQSERTILPDILGVFSFEEVMKTENFDAKILFATEKDFKSTDLNEVKQNLINQNVKNILIIIGPEGGFSKAELAKAIESDVVLSKMNLPILRTETAGVVAAGFLLI